MKPIAFSILVFCLSLCSVIAKGQEVHQQDSIVQEASNIVQDEETEMKKSIANENAKLRKEIEDLEIETAKISSLSSQLNSKLKEIGDSIILKNEYLKARQDSAKQDVKVLKEKINNLNAEKKRLATEKSNLEAQLQETRDAAEKLNNHMSENDTYSKAKNEKRKNELEKEYNENKEILYRAFSGILPDDIRHIKDNVSKFSSMADIADYKKRVADLDKKYALYKNCKGTLEHMEGVKKVVDLRDQLLAYLDVKKDNAKTGSYAFNQEQRNEMQDLNVALSRFKGGINALKEVMDMVNSDESVKQSIEEQDEEKCREAIERVLSSEDVNQKAERYFNIIPALKNSYENYKKEKQSHPLETSIIEQEIKELVIE